jgi:hypothetical protein
VLVKALIDELLVMVLIGVCSVSLELSSRIDPRIIDT